MNYQYLETSSSNIKMNIVINKHVWFQYQEKHQQGYQNIRQTYGDYAIGSIISKRLQSKMDTPNNLNSAIKKMFGLNTKKNINKEIKIFGKPMVIM